LNYFFGKGPQIRNFKINIPKKIPCSPRFSDNGSALSMVGQILFGLWITNLPGL
jgi:hypothetical protein